MNPLKNFLNNKYYLQFLLLFLINLSKSSGLVFFNEDDSQTLTLLPNQTELISIISSNKDVEFSLVSVHSQLNKISLSYDDPTVDKKYTRNRKINGLNIGLVVVFDGNSYPKQSKLFVSNKNNLNSRIYVRVLQFNGFYPIPGGCNLEFSIPISAFLNLKATNLNLALEFQKASLGSNFLITKGQDKKLNCDFSANKFNYEVYSYYLKENDYSEQEYISGLSRMSSVDSIEAYGTKLDILTFRPKTRVQILAYRGKGVIYNVVVSFLNFKTAYVPIVSYDCDLSDKNSCKTYQNWFQILYFLVSGLLGLIICLDASKHQKLQVVYLSFLIGTTITFILLSKYSNINQLKYSYSIILSGGLIPGLISFLIWLKYSSDKLALILSGIHFEFLLISIIQSANFFNIIQLNHPIIWGIVTASALLIIPGCAIFIDCNKLNTICCSIFGSYMFVISIEQFFSGSLIYLVMNMINKIIYTDLFLMESNLPFQTIDYLTCLTWFILVFLSLFLNLFVNCDIFVTKSFLNSLKCFILSIISLMPFKMQREGKKYEEIETVDNKDEDISKYNELSRTIIGSFNNLNNLDKENEICNTSFNNSGYSSPLVKRKIHTLNNSLNNQTSTKIDIPSTPSLSSRSSRCSTPQTPKLNQFKLDHLEFLNQSMTSTPNTLLKNVVIQNARYSTGKSRI